MNTTSSNLVRFQRINARGFTLVELLVVIAIIGVLISLLLPGIMASREAARRTQCTHHLTQLSVGLHQYEMAHERFPPGSINPKGPIRNVAQGDHRNWIIQLLPYLDETNVYRHIDQTVGVYHANNAGVRATEIQFLACPSEPGAPGMPPGSNYAAVHHDMEAPIDTDNHGAFFLNSHVHYADITDGAAHTLFIGEKLIEPMDLGWMSGTRATLRNTGAPLNAIARAVTPWPAPAAGNEDADAEAATNKQTAEPVVAESAASSEPASSEPAQSTTATDSKTANRADESSDNASGTPVSGNAALVVGGFSSNHSGGVNFLFGDGSVRFIPESINQQILQQLAHRSDGKLPPASY